MTQTMQRDLFTPEEAASAQAAGLYADVVFDRPLDHAYTYAVGSALRDSYAFSSAPRAFSRAIESDGFRSA